MSYPPTALFVLSPWYGLLEITQSSRHGQIECWDGDHFAFYPADTLRPLTPAAARMLEVKWGTKVWDEKRKRALENAPFLYGWFPPEYVF